MDLHLALVVDEDAEVRQLATNNLSVLGYQAVASTLGDPALDALISRQPALVLQGISEGQNPLALHEHLAAESAATKLVLVGSNHDPRLMRSIADHARFHDLSVVGQIQRPICSKQLSAVCRPLLLAHPLATKPVGLKVAPSMPTRRRLMDAIQSDLIAPWFQPIFCAHSHRIVRWEVLARWQHDDGTYYSPSQFVRMAERTGLIDKLFSRVLNRALLEARSWGDLNRPSRLALNLSMANLGNPALVDDLMAAVADNGLAPEGITLEITESTISGCTERMLGNICRLRMAGFPVAIDDFGTGISGLARLSTIPFTELKLDRQFVRNIDANTVNQHICRNAISMAHDLGMTAVAEGIEIPEEAQAVIDFGADELQGFLYGRPMPANEALRFTG